ncbi:replication initiation protein, partial [Lacticaseibacillus paracasei]
MQNYSLDKERSYPVVKANTLVQKARHQLTAKELKLVDFMVSKVREDDTGFKPIETSIAEINQVMS